MTTALDLITDALVEIGVAQAGQALAPEDAELGLRKLNQLLQRWANDRLTLPVITTISVPMTGAASYTIGPTGAVVASRPLSVDAATAVDNGGTEYPVNTLTRALWDCIAVKAVDGGPPSDVWYEAIIGNGRINVYPRSSGYTLKLQCLTLLTSFSVLATAVSLPEGYESAIYLNLADDLASSFGRQLSADSRRRAAGALRAIKRTNAEPLLLTIDAGQTSEYRIERGY
jgi:hypothetical protein